MASFHALVLGLVLGVVVVAVVRQFTASVEQLATGTLTTELQDFAANVPASGTGCALADRAAQYFAHRGIASGTVLALGVPNCRVVGTGTIALKFVHDPTVRTWLATIPERTMTGPAQVAGYRMEVLRAPVVAHGRRVGVFVAAVDLAPFQSQESRVQRLAIAEATLALVAAVASVFIILRRLLRTIGRITTTAEEISDGEIDRRLAVQGTADEVDQLAVTFDRMLDRLAGAMASQRRLLSDVSHQLRTPLTIARGHLEVLQRTGVDDPEAVSETIGVVVDEIDHMRALVERLLMLGRAMEPDFLAVAPIDLRAMLADVFATGRVLAERDWRLEPGPDVVIVADEAKLRGALLNLLDNAAKATRSGDIIELSASVVGESPLPLVLRVDDSGPGIPGAERELVLGRFSRPGARDTAGSGLGLAIVAAVADAHGGDVTIGDSPYGGCRVQIALPASVIDRAAQAHDPALQADRSAPPLESERL
jgi:signal transduction histidine kinase